MDKFKAAAALVALVSVTGCVIDGPGRGGPGGDVSVRNGVDGTWSDANGVATSTLNNGSFVSIANDTGSRVAEGNYRYTPNGTIEISYYSILRQTNIRANCALATQAQLNCTNESGQQFSLFRRSAIS